MAIAAPIVVPPAPEREVIVQPLDSLGNSWAGEAPGPLNEWELVNVMLSPIPEHELIAVWRRRQSPEDKSAWIRQAMDGYIANFMEQLAAQQAAMDIVGRDRAEAVRPNGGKAAKA